MPRSTTPRTKDILLFEILSDNLGAIQCWGGCDFSTGDYFSNHKKDNTKQNTIGCDFILRINPATATSGVLKQKPGAYNYAANLEWNNRDIRIAASVPLGEPYASTSASGNGSARSIFNRTSYDAGHDYLGVRIGGLTYVPSSGPAGTYTTTTTIVCDANAYHNQESTKAQRQIVSRVTIPAQVSIQTPGTVDFGRVVGGGGEIQRDLPIEFTTNGDTRVQFSLQAPPFDDGSKYTGALGSYLYTVYSDSSWVGGPTGTLSIMGDWNSLPVKMGTSSYKLKVGLKPTGKPFVAGTHSTNLTVTARVL